MDTFLKALEEVYSLEPADRFMETSPIWQAIALDLCRSVEVDPADMNKLSEKYVAVLVEKNILHPITDRDRHALHIHRKGQPSEGLQVQQNFPLGVQTSSGRRPGLPEARYHRPVPACL